MSLEPGGRTDKEGNVYENRFLARLLLQVINEKLHYVQVEPVEKNSDYAEFIAVDWEGKRRYYQCKSSNGDCDHWRLSDMKAYEIFSNAKKIVCSDAQNEYVFISPLGYDGLDSLCNRARTSSSPEDFVTYQLNQKYRSYFDTIAQTLQLDTSMARDRAKLVGILSRCYFETYGRSREEREDLEAQIGYMFLGPAETVRILLEQYANDNRQYGVKITAEALLKYLKRQKIKLRNICRDESVLSQIQTLNNVQWGTFLPINNTLLHRDTTQQLIRKFEEGSCIILHGRAGAGKSGCTEEFIQYLKKQEIMYLAIKLDKEIPQKSADDYGKSLGLPQSPVYCLNAFSPEKQCVLILDQLDSLRWTSTHSATALDVCKEMISQAAELIEEHGAHLSILLVSRTFDLDTDPGLQSLFETPQQEKGIKWSKVQVGLLSENEVEGIVGKSYAQMPLKLKKTLQVPSSLFVWSRLEHGENQNAVTSSFQLMEKWWSQIQNRCHQMSLEKQDVCNCKDKIVSRIDQLGQLALPATIFADDKNIVEAFVSNGLLVANHKTIAFAHQSFLDYFLAQKAIQNIYDGHNLAHLYQSISQQMPSLRYRFLMILQTLLDVDADMFVRQAKNVLQCDVIHYYFQCAVFETIGQWEGQIEPAVYSLVKQYQMIPKWERFIFRTVYMGHPNFIEHYFDDGEANWLGEDGIELLRSISDVVPNFVLACVQPYAFQEQATDQKIFSVLSRDVANDSDEMFAFRLKMLKKYPRAFQHSVLFWGPAHLPIKRLLDLLSEVLDAEELWGSEHIFFGESNDWREIVPENYSEIVKILFPRICTVTQKLICPGPYHNTIWENRPWEKHEHSHSVARKLVEFVKMALEEYVSQNPQAVFDDIVCSTEGNSIVGHELIMYAVSLLPDSFGTKVLQWLLKDFRRRIFVYTFDENDYLFYTKKIISRFSKFCDAETLQLLEETIYKWNDDPAYAKEKFRTRIKTNRESKYAPVYYAYWGYMQKELLPAIDERRLSEKARNLLAVVQRNDWICVPFYHAGILSGDGGMVVSPIDGKADRLSDQKWLEIISTPEGKMKHFVDRRPSDGGLVEASPFMFASSLQVCAKKQPNRFAKLAFSFPEDCFPGYMAQVFYGIADSETPIDNELVCQLIQKYFQHKDNVIVSAILDLICKTAENEWPEEILSIVMWLALHHPNPQENTYVSHSGEDPDDKTIQTIRNSALNCVRGKALFTLAALIDKHPEWLCKVKRTVEDAANDTNDSVRFALVQLAALFYQTDPDFVRSILQKLLVKDIRVIESPGSWYVIRQEFPKNPSYYRKILVDGCQSKADDVAACAAGKLCASVFLFKDSVLLNWLRAQSLSHKQLEKVCKQAVYCFQEEEYRKQSEVIIQYCIQTATEKLMALHSLFYDNRLDLQRDREFILYLMSTEQAVELSHAFFEYLNASRLRGKEYATYLRAISSLERTNSDWYFWDTPKFVDSVLRLLDDNKGDNEIIEMALDIWDQLYESNFFKIQQLSAMLNNLE